MGVARSGSTTVGRMLAETLGWPLVEAHAPHALHMTAAGVLGRREHLVITSAPLTSRDREAVRDNLHGVRFVDLADRDEDPEEIVRAIRREFGL